MFTGIIEAVGTVGASEARDGDLRIRIDGGELDLDSVKSGDSVAVAGVCVTVLQPGGGGFSADLSRETLDRTTLGRARVGTPVNLERALRLNSPLGGHLVSGHVDGVGQVVNRRSDGRSERFEFEVEADLARFIAVKGSIAVDGVSLTVNRVAGARFDVNLIPHTLTVTTLGRLSAGEPVNIEVDLMARYAARWAETATPDRQRPAEGES